MIYILYIIIFVLAILLTISVYKLYQYSLIIFQFEMVVNDTIEQLIRSEKTINDIIQKPIFFDSPEIRSVFLTIRESREEILRLINKMSKINTKKENDDS